MQAKLTLRMDADVIQKAKHLAQRKGQSVSRLVSDYFLEQTADDFNETLPPITQSMLGALRSTPAKTVNEEDFKTHLEEKYL